MPVEPLAAARAPALCSHSAAPPPRHTCVATHPAAEAKLLLLAQKAASPEELDAALQLTRVNRVRATRMKQYHPYTTYMPAALLQVGVLAVLAVLIVSPV